MKHVKGVGQAGMYKRQSLQELVIPSCSLCKTHTEPDISDSHPPSLVMLFPQTLLYVVQQEDRAQEHPGHYVLCVCIWLALF